MIPTLGTRALLIAFWQGVLASHQNILCLGDKLSDNQCSRQIGSLLTTAAHCCSVSFQIYCSRWRWLTLPSSWLLCWLSWLRLRAKFYLIVTPQSPAFILTIFRETFIKMLILRIHNGDNILLWSPHWRLEAADDSLWRVRHQDGRVDLGSGSIIFTTTIPESRKMESHVAC